VLSKFLSPFGRLSRGGAWLWLILFPLVFQIVVLGTWHYWPNMPYLLQVADWAQFIYLWPTIVLQIKRFHDVGLSGLWYFVLMIVGYTGFGFGYLRIIAGVKEEGGLDFVNLISEMYDFDPEILENVVSTVASMPSFLVPVAWIAFVFSMLFLFVITFVKPGVVDENRFGPDPLGD